VSADHHVHLNGSGVNELELQDLLLPMQGEDLDFAAPMAWNQYNRFIDAHRIGQKAAAKDGTAAWLTQEVRSDYHGHVGMIGATEPFQPWFFGPTNPVYGNRDLHNGLVNPFAKAQGAWQHMCTRSRGQRPIRRSCCQRIAARTRRRRRALRWHRS
jgi:TolB protein